MEQLIPFDQISLSVVCLIFAVAAGIVWFAGTRLSRYAEAISHRTGTAEVVMGSLFLAGVTSLPEIVTTITASSLGDAGMAVNNLLGGVAMQTTILAFADFAVRGRSITSLIGSEVIQLQALATMLLLATVTGVMVAGDTAVGPVSVGSVLVFIELLACFFLTNYLESIGWFKVRPEARDNVARIKKIVAEQEHRAQDENPDEIDAADEGRQSLVDVLKSRLFLYFILAATAVLVGGFALVQAGQAFSEKTGIGSSLVGAVFIAISTSLPEVSTTVSAIRMKAYRLAFSNIFGTNIFTVGFVFFGDIFFSGGPILNQTDRFAVFGGLLGIVVTTLFIGGLILRLKKTVLGVGYDSLLVIIAYLGGVAILVSLAIAG